MLRIEDLDRTRCKPQFEAAIVDDLAWLGLRFPPPRRQSEHGDDYAAALARLDSEARLPLFLQPLGDRSRLEWQRDPDGAPLYPGTCRAFTGRGARSSRARRQAPHSASTCGAPSTGRQRDLAGPNMARAPFPRSICGAGGLGRRRPSRPRSGASYHLAVVVDDALQGVTDVVRGRDLLAATAVHRLLQALLGVAAPRYRHHRLVLDRDGAKLSKSRQSWSLAGLRASRLEPGRSSRGVGVRRWRGAGFRSSSAEGPR